jgi:hypothetical protein
MSGEVLRMRDEPLLDLDVAVTLGQAAAWLGCDPGRIRNWISRGWVNHATGKRVFIAPADEADASGHRRYRLGDLLAAERGTRRNPRGRRRGGGSGGQLVRAA